MGILNGILIKLPWYLHPDRNEEWFKLETENMSQKEIAQEYECDFISSGDTVVDPGDIKFYVNNFVCDPFIAVDRLVKTIRIVINSDVCFFIVQILLDFYFPDNDTQYQYACQ